METIGTAVGVGVAVILMLALATAFVIGMVAIIGAPVAYMVGVAKGVRDGR